MEHSSRFKAVFSITIATLFWGTTYPVIKFGLSQLHLTPLSFLTLRFLSALASLTPLLLIKSIREEFIWSISKPDILILGILNGVAYALQFIGQVSTTAGIATIMVSTYVLFTLLFGHFILGKKINLRKKIAVFIGFSGVVIIAMGDLINMRGESNSFYGMALTLGTGICAGLYVTFSEKVYELTFNERKLNPVTIFFTSTVYSSLIIACAGLFIQDLPHFSSLTLPALLPVLYLGVLCTSGAFIMYLIAVREAGAVNTAVFMLLQIIISIIFAFVLLSEMPDVFMIVGSPLIFVAIYLTQEKEKS
jgi:drug/metabolite transporter (DMT)-like permease